MNYQLIHDSIIESAKNSDRSKGNGNYYEAHHIVPKCMGGEGKTTQWRTHPNIVLLTCKEHTIIHRLLCEIYPDNHKLFTSYFMLTNGGNKKHHKVDVNYRVSAREYERLKIEYIKLMSGENNPCFGRTGENNPCFGRTGEKHPMFGKKRLQHSNRMSGENNPMFGKGEKRSGEKNPKAKKVICSITGKIYGCIKDAAKDFGISYETLKNCLKGIKPNKTSLRYL
tara:strand:- start:15 stop:689 length:675 start_codon:yes stop_codon:yes gene_type:complete